MTKPHGLLLANGVDCGTGRALFAGETLDGAAAYAANTRQKGLAELYVQLKRKDGEKTRAPIEGVDANDIAQAGWGVVFGENNDDLAEHLRPLLEYRKQQAGVLYREFAGARCAEAADTKASFLKRLGVPASGPVDPKKMPYYLLLVGSPEEIPFSLQYELDVQHAVGRIHFDEPEDYARYARQVVAAEEGRIQVGRRAAFVAPSNWQDEATFVSLHRLVTPVARFVESKWKDWTVERLFKEDAFKANLTGLLRQSEPPALLFTASHGAWFDCGHGRQVQHQGALVMQDWEGGAEEVPPEMYFSADDVTDQLCLRGMIGFHFACSSGGVPANNDFHAYAADETLRAATRIAERPFVAALPKRLLAAGALAVIAHVDTAFASAFEGSGSTAAYESTIHTMMEGGRVGLAMDYFNLRHAELSVRLATAMDQGRWGKEEEREDLSRSWVENNDARNYILLGDPAVTMPLRAGGKQEKARLERRIAQLETELAALKGRLLGLPSGTE